MNSVTNRYLSQHLPFQELTDFDIGINFQSARERITELMDLHGLVEFLKGNYLSELFDPQDLVLCSYYDESEFVKSNRNSENNLNVISMNIRSLPNHHGELLCMLSMLEIRFDVIILTEIRARNITHLSRISHALPTQVPRTLATVSRRPRNSRSPASCGSAPDRQVWRLMPEPRSLTWPQYTLCKKDIRHVLKFETRMPRLLIWWLLIAINFTVKGSMT